MYNLFIFGESHGNEKECIEIQNQIRKINPDILLLELLYEDEVWNKEEALNRIKNCEIGGVCDPRLNLDLYQLAAELNIPCIGIDLDDDKIEGLSTKEQFKMREKHMVEMIKGYMVSGNVVVVLGDTHLRTINTDELGSASLIQKEFRNKAKIFRSKFYEIE